MQLASSVLISKCHSSYRESISGFKETESFCKKTILLLQVTVFLLAVLEKQDCGVCVFNTKSRFADITVICTVYIQMSFKKKHHQNLRIIRVCKSEHLSSFYRLKSNCSSHFSQLQNIRLHCL